MGKDSIPFAVVLHIANTGYGVVRSLAGFNIPIVAFQKGHIYPESRSRLCERIIFFENNEELLNKMISFSLTCLKRPVLFITSDIYVDFYLQHRETIDQYYKIHYPDNHTVKMLLSKEEFSLYAKKHNLLIPGSFNIDSFDSLYPIKVEASFPLIIKPYVRTEMWVRAGLQKAYLVDTFEELVSVSQKLFHYEKHLIAQEWIPGPDTNIEYCLVYFDENSKCISSFTGIKIRQWPLYTGSTAATKMIDNNQLRDYTIEFFTSLNYQGFGSLEFKRHNHNGNYYIIEPTVGRPDLQSYIATANGENMPLKAYAALTGLAFVENFSDTESIYILNWFDMFSALKLIKSGELSISGYFNSKKGKKVYSYYDERDKRVYMASFLYIIRKLIKKILRKINND